MTLASANKSKEISRWRQFCFYVAIAACVSSFLLIPFYEKWYQGQGSYSALSNPALTYWINGGAVLCLISILLALFGRGWSRLSVIVPSILGAYYWTVLSIAV
jgi:hypothetical protein